MLENEFKKEISCRLTRTLLLYVREKNGDSLGELLDGLAFDEAYLMDTHNWVSHTFLQILYDRMIYLLGDPDAVYNMTLASGRLQSLGILDRVVRLLGSPRLILKYAPQYNRFLKLNGSVRIIELHDSWAVLEDRYHDAGQKTRYDCDYTRGILAGIPTLFGLPQARVEEIGCQVAEHVYGRRLWPDHPAQNQEACRFRVQWQVPRVSRWRRLFSPRLYQRAIHDLVDANQLIQEKYDEVRRLANDLEAANRELKASKRQLELQQDSLKVSEKRYRLLAENATDTIWIVSLETMRFEYVSPSVKRMRGYTPEEAMALELNKTLSPASLSHVLEVLSEELGLEERPGIDPKRSRTIEIQHSKKDGSYGWAEVTVSFIRDHEAQPTGVLGVSRDIADRLAADRALKESEEKYRTIVQHAPAGIYEIDLQTMRFTSVNDVMCIYSGYTEKEFLALDPYALLTPESEPVLDNLLAEIFAGEQNPNPVEYTIRGKNDREFQVFVNARIFFENGVPQRAMAVVHDVTEIRKAEGEKANLEKQLQQAQKLEAIGTLAGGIAHDFNNLLMGIQGNASLLLLAAEMKASHTERLTHIETYVQRGVDLTSQLLGLARGGKYEVKPTDINELIQNSATLFGRTRKEIRIQTHCLAEGGSVEIDRGQIEQVLLNLFINAWQAMPEGGDLVIKTENASLDEIDGQRLIIKPGGYIKISISDTGVGMDEATRLQVFDPFFTTKEIGRGTGLGLASSYGIIKNHDGALEVYSAPGQGATFTILLPATDKPVEGKITPQTDVPIRGSGSIMLVDDEEMVLDVGRQIMEALGYDVIPVPSGLQAVQLYAQNPSAVHLIILDLIMPGLGGGEVYDQLKALNPDVKVLLSSGYSESGQAARILERGCVGFLQKPFKIMELSQKLRDVLD